MSKWYEVLATTSRSMLVQVEDTGDADADMRAALDAAYDEISTEDGNHETEVVLGPLRADQVEQVRRHCHSELKL